MQAGKMMKKNKNNKNTKELSSSRLKSHTKHGIVAVIFFVLAVFCLMAWLNVAGVAGDFFYNKIFLPLLGVGYVLLPVLFILLGCSFVKSEVPNIGWMRMISGAMFLLASEGIIDIASGTHAGGFFGEILSTPLVSLFDIYASIIFLGAILIISILVIFDAKLDLGP